MSRAVEVGALVIRCPLPEPVVRLPDTVVYNREWIENKQIKEQEPAAQFLFCNIFHLAKCG